MPRFEIPEVVPTTHITIRLPKSTVELIRDLIAKRECTISAFVSAAVIYALENMEEEI